MSRLFRAYQTFHKQGFIPIFVDDNFNSRLLIEACVAAGIKGIEYTLRRKDADRMIPWIRRNYPDLYILAGSTLDNENIVVKARRRHPQLLTLSQLDGLDVDGFVSIVGWNLDSIRKYSGYRIVIPAAASVTEAFQQVGAGAHFIKLLCPDIPLIRGFRNDASFDYCPIMVTGGMTLERIPKAIEAGAVLIGSGFDLILKKQPTGVSVRKIAGILKNYLNNVKEARARKWPCLAKAINRNDQVWLDSLPHHHPF